jgi:two-component system response regulator ResD
VTGLKFSALVVDDEAPMRQLVRIYLTNVGITVIEAESGKTALSIVEQQKIHLIVLDLMMPDMDGLQVAEVVKGKYPAMPILMLTARGTMDDKITGFAVGADDYLVKPFDGRELVARVQVLLRRSYPTSNSIYFPYIDLTIDAEARNVLVAGNAVPLTQIEFDILQLLAEHPKRTFPREEMLERVWGIDYFGDTRTIDSHIKNIREKFRHAGISQDPIQTVWGIGYKFEVEGP